MIYFGGISKMPGLPLEFRRFGLILSGLVSVCILPKRAFSEDHRPTIVTTAPPSSWLVASHPLAEANRKESWLRNLVHGQLVILDQNWRWQCQLCVSLPSPSNGLLRVARRDGASSKNSRQNLVIDFEIPAHAKWGDGKPLVADDFLLALEIARSMPPSTKSGSLARAILELSPDAKNNRHFFIRLREPRGDFWFAFGLRPVPSHLESEIWKASEKNYKDYLHSTNYVINPSQPGLYSGPWFPKNTRLRNEGEAQSILLEANPSFGGGKVIAHSIQILFRRAEKDAAADLQSGVADIIPETDLSPAAAKLITRKNAIRTALGSELEHIDFNTRNPLLTDVNLRKAISLMINRYDLARTTGMPAGLPMALGFMHPAMTGSPVRTDRGDLLRHQAFQHPVWGYAPSEAAALLQQSGWIREASNHSSLWIKEGSPLEVDLDTNRPDQIRMETVRSVARQLTSAGIKVNIKEHANDAFIREILGKVKFRYLAEYAWRIPAGTIPDAVLDSKQIPSLQNGYTGENTSGWSNRRLDEILDQVRDEWDPAARQQSLQQIETLAATDVPFIPLFYRPVLGAAVESVAGFEVPGHEGWSSSFATNWNFSSATLGK